jgi:hypothetical protein
MAQFNQRISGRNRTNFSVVYAFKDDPKYGVVRMLKIAGGIALAGLMSGSLVLGGCATIESKDHAQATADQATTAAQAANAAAQQAQSTADSAGAAAQRAQSTADAAASAAQAAGSQAQAAASQAQAAIAARSQTPEK